MRSRATSLRERIATLRYQFLYMERGSKRPDAPADAHAAVRAAVAHAQHACAGVPLFAGGKSYGGRMTSQAQAIAPLPGVRGLAFVGFPAASCLASPPTSVRVISTTCAFRCCSCPARATSSRSSHLLEPVIDAPRRARDVASRRRSRPWPSRAAHGAGAGIADVRAQAAATLASWIGAVVTQRP